MDEAEENDVRLLKATTEAIRELKVGLPRFLKGNDRENRGDSGQTDVEFNAQLDLIITKVDYFQEDPQFLDGHLGPILRTIIEKTLALISHEDYKNEESKDSQYFQALMRILYALCKVRGEKVIQRLLKNEPRYIYPILNVFCPRMTPESIDNAQSPQYSSTGPERNVSVQPLHLKWQGQYFFLLWLAHLLLTPFDLSTISSDTTVTRSDSKIPIPDEIPPLAKDVMIIASQHIDSSSRDQKSAATVLVILALRPDMRRMGVLDGLIAWAMKFLESASNIENNMFESIGVLQFINGIVSSASVHDIIKYLSSLFSLVGSIFNGEEDSSRALRSSAVAKKLAIKIERNIVAQVLLLDPDSTSEHMPDALPMLEEVVDYLLRSLADRETPVRYASSKALGIITSKLESGMAEDIVESILDLLNENVLDEGKSRNLNMVNPLQWHGLALTLSHMLFRRSPTPGQLPKVLNALYSTLAFEQRSATGTSVGSNVRDAANFGLWSLARRYSTRELELVPVKQLNFAATDSLKHQPAIQRTAVELLVAACLDPTGNIRRGSSAALQELVGRHPDTVDSGISLIQIVDYHAVGLRQRAMVDVAFQAGGLSDMFRQALIEALLGWSGIRAIDILSRSYAATSFARLCSLGPLGSGLKLLLDRIVPTLETLASREVEWRHGLVLLISETVTEAIRQARAASEAGEGRKSLQIELLRQHSQLWALFNTTLDLKVKDFTRVALHTELIVEATLSLLEALSNCSYVSSGPPEPRYLDKAISTFTACLIRADSTSFHRIPPTCLAVMQVLNRKQQLETVKTWLRCLDNEPKSNRSLGLLIAISSASITLVPEESNSDEINSVKHDITRRLILASNDPEHISTRVAAIKSITAIVQAHKTNPKLVELDYNQSIGRSISQDLTQHNVAVFLPCITKGLDDYTINERGDVGSLVRLEAISFMSVLQNMDLPRGFPGPFGDEMTKCILALLRLSLEKLDKVRVQAARVLNGYLAPTASSESDKDGIESVTDVSTYQYFFNIGIEALSAHHSRLDSHLADSNSREAIMVAYLKGIMSCTGGGSESIMQVSREALYDLLDYLPLYAPATPSLLRVCSTILDILSDTIQNSSAGERDRTLPAQLETILFLLDTGLLWRLRAHSSAPTTSLGKNTETAAEPKSELETTPPPGFKYMTLLSLIQKSHFKSTSLQKLFLAIRIYTHLASSSSSSPCSSFPSSSSHSNDREEKRNGEEHCKSTHEGLDNLREENYSLRAYGAESGGGVPERVRNEALKKLLSMLVHPYARVRIAAAEGIWSALYSFSSSLSSPTADNDDETSQQQQEDEAADQEKIKEKENANSSSNVAVIMEQMKSTEWGSRHYGKGTEIEQVQNVLKQQAAAAMSPLK